MRVLFINHYFEQDIEELVFFKRKEHEFHWISPQYFAREVKKFLPVEVFDGLTAYHKSQYRHKRIQLDKTLRKRLFELYKTYQFDIIISPSDTFFYIRALVDACHEIGVPFFVAQKETTISPGTMEIHSKDIGKYFPFISDFMTVCSENHKKFWLRANTPENRIKVTGQPRFDFYYRFTKEKLKTENINISAVLDNNKKNLLFFTYELDAYLESAGDSSNWKELREKTEDVLATVAKTGRYNILIKPHPQHSHIDIEYFTNRIKSLLDAKSNQSIFIIDRKYDARKLIILADIIVAFQTTAFLEALALGKKVIYTFFGVAAKQKESFILPFHKYNDICDVVHSPQELLTTILSFKTEQSIDKEILTKRIGLFKKYLGPFDGKASMRTWAAIEEIFSRYSSLTKEQKSQRRKILKLKTCHVFKNILACSIYIFIDNLLIILFKIISQEKYANKIETYVSLRKRRKKELQEVRNKLMISSFQIIGPIKNVSFKEKLVKLLKLSSK